MMAKKLIKVAPQHNMKSLIISNTMLSLDHVAWQAAKLHVLAEFSDMRRMSNERWKDAGELSFKQEGEIKYNIRYSN